MKIQEFVFFQHIQDSDYINASFIQCYKQKYISCQAPLPNTTQHFWLMIWEQRSSIIIMLTRIIEGERKKADIYWPNEGNTEEYGSISVELTSVCKFPNITIRIFNIRHSNSTEVREIVQLHYTEWPDFGVPKTTHSIRDLIRLMNLFKERQALNGPIIAHCSAGIGRCGSFFGILGFMEKLHDGITIDKISMLDIVVQMRKSRCGMVQTDIQYIFMHQVLEDMIREKQLKYPKRLTSSCRLSSSFDEIPPRQELESKKKSNSVISVHQ